MKLEEGKEQKQLAKKQKKKNLSAALRKNLMRRKALDQKAEVEGKELRENLN